MQPEFGFVGGRGLNVNRKRRRADPRFLRSPVVEMRILEAHRRDDETDRARGWQRQRRTIIREDGACERCQVAIFLELELEMQLLIEGCGKTADRCVQM